MYMNAHMPYLNIHGHIHGNRMSNGLRELYLNASVELHDYAPFDLDQAIAGKMREWNALQPSNRDKASSPDRAPATENPMENS
jgi:calcineurin-like phosphoesterase family protein